MGAPPPRPRPAPGRGAPPHRWGAEPADSKLFLFKKKKLCAAPSGSFFFPPSFLVSPSPFFLLKVSFLPLYPSLPLDRMADSTSVSINFFFPPPLLHLNKFKAPPPTLNSPNLINWALRAAARESERRGAPGAGVWDSRPESRRLRLPRTGTFTTHQRLFLAPCERPR